MLPRKVYLQFLGCILTGASAKVHVLSMAIHVCCWVGRAVLGYFCVSNASTHKTWQLGPPPYIQWHACAYHPKSPKTKSKKQSLNLEILSTACPYTHLHAGLFPDHHWWILLGLDVRVHKLKPRLKTFVFIFYLLWHTNQMRITVSETLHSMLKRVSTVCLFTHLHTNRLPDCYRSTVPGSVVQVGKLHPGLTTFVFVNAPMKSGSKYAKTVALNVERSATLCLFAHLHAGQCDDCHGSMLPREDVRVGKLQPRLKTFVSIFYLL